MSTMGAINYQTTVLSVKNKLLHTPTKSILSTGQLFSEKDKYLSHLMISQLSLQILAKPASNFNEVTKNIKLFKPNYLVIQGSNETHFQTKKRVSSFASVDANVLVQTFLTESISLDTVKSVNSNTHGTKKFSRVERMFELSDRFCRHLNFMGLKH